MRELCVACLQHRPVFLLPFLLALSMVVPDVICVSLLPDCSFPASHTPILLLVHHCQGDCNLITTSKVRQEAFRQFPYKMVWALLVPLHFHRNLRVSFGLPCPCAFYFIRSLLPLFPLFFPCLLALTETASSRVDGSWGTAVPNPVVSLSFPQTSVTLGLDFRGRCFSGSECFLLFCVC